jgi:hypothetical protein
MLLQVPFYVSGAEFAAMSVLVVSNLNKAFSALSPASEERENCQAVTVLQLEIRVCMPVV